MKAPSDRAAFYASLAKAQGEMGSALKDSKNPHFRSDYASLASVLAAVLPALNRHGLALVQTIDLEGGVVTVGTMVVHNTGEQLTFSSSCPLGGRKDVQALGSTVTYLRRYSVMAFFGIAPVDDDGNDAARGENLARRPDNGSWAKDKPEFEGALESLGLSLAAVVEYCGRQKWSDPRLWVHNDRAQLLADIISGQHPGLHRPAVTPPVRRAAEAHISISTRSVLNAKELSKALAGMGLDLGTVVAWCAAHDRTTPILMAAAQQEKMLSWLEDGGIATVNRWAAAQVDG